MQNFEYLEPDTVPEACGLLKQYGGDAKVYAGGAYLTIVMKQGLLQPKVLVNIKKIAALKGIRFDSVEGLSIGALVTHHELETSDPVRGAFPILCEVEKEVANIRVRNVGTIGGNLASGEPLTDLAQVFISLDGRIEIAGPGGSRAVPIEQFFVDYYQTSLADDEILTQVLVPPLPDRSGIEYIRFSSSSVVDKPCVGVSVRITLEPGQERCHEARIVLGCVGATPLRVKKAEEVLLRQPLSEDRLEEAGKIAAQECNPVSDLRGSEQYKRAIVRVLVRRAGRRAYQRALGLETPS